MKKIYALIIILFLASDLFAATKYWVGTTGNYSVGANWNTMPDGSGTSGTPVNTDDIVIDRNASITIDGTYLPSSVWVINNAIVNFINTSTAKIYTIGGGAVSPSFKIEGGSTLNVTGTGSITLEMFAGNAEIYGTLDFTGNNSKMNYNTLATTTRIKTGGKIRYGGLSSNAVGTTTSFFMESGSTYEVYKDGGIFPTGSFDQNSLLLNSGAVANAASFSMNSAAGSYGNYEFNSPIYTGTSVGVNQNTTFNNFTLTDDGSGKWIFSTSPSSIYTLTVNGNLSISGGSTLTINNATSGNVLTTLLVKGNINNNGLITEAIGNIGSVIEIGGNTSTTFSSVANGITNDVNMKMNKSSGTLTALTDINLPNSPNAKLTLSNGNIDVLTNNKILFIQNPASVALITGSASSHVIGKLKRSSNQLSGYIFPVSNDGIQIAKATITTSNSNPTDWTVEFIPTNSNASAGLTSGVIDIVSNYYWNISRTGATPADAGFLTLYYSGLTTSSVLIPSQVKIVHWNGSTWDNLGGVDGGGSVDNTLGSTGGSAPGDPITTFSPFAIAGTIGTLPISIEYFHGIKNITNNTLLWKINCSGNSNVRVILEHSTTNNNFQPIYSLNANALRCLQPFDKTDFNLSAGINYYRLKVIDENGKINFSKIIGLLNKESGVELLGILPNPVSNNETAILSLSAAQKTVFHFLITDMSGKQIYKDLKTLAAGDNQLTLNLPDLSSGSYVLTGFTDEGRKVSIQFIKN